MFFPATFVVPLGLADSSTAGASIFPRKIKLLSTSLSKPLPRFCGTGRASALPANRIVQNATTNWRDELQNASERTSDIMIGPFWVLMVRSRFRRRISASQNGGGFSRTYYRLQINI